MWMHREPEIYEMFTTLMTEYGKMLALTPKHLVFRNKCDGNYFVIKLLLRIEFEEWYEDYIETLPPNSEAVFADELEVGDCMILWYKVRENVLISSFPPIYSCLERNICYLIS